MNGTAGERSAATSRTIAALVVVAIAVRFRLPPDIPLAFLVSVALLPVTVQQLSDRRWAMPITTAAVVAAASGIAISAVRSDHVTISQSLLIVQTVRVLCLAVVLVSLLWARSLLGTRMLVQAFAVGSLVSLALTGLNSDNVWKFSLAVPVSLLVLSLRPVWGRRMPQAVALAALAAVSAAFDSRSLSAMLVIAMVVTLLQGRRRPGAPATSAAAWVAIGRLGVLGIACFLLVQAAILEGMLGEAAQSRTEMQIDRSGSSLVGGRPEMGAAAALIADRPFGYGAGALVTYGERWIGKEGLAALGYDPDNGYVDGYMFGNGLEVHSVLGDLWLHYGVPGAVLAVLIVAALLHSLGVAVAGGSASAAAVLLAARSLWDMPFSPFASAMLTLPLALAVLLPLRAASAPESGDSLGHHRAIAPRSMPAKRSSTARTNRFDEPRPA